MEHGRYDMTLEDVPGMILSIRQTGVPVGLTATHTEPGFLLSDGTALLECEKDENGFYVGGAGMDGMYLKTGRLYEPVRDEDGAVTGFRQMSRFLGTFTGEEQKIIYQYASNTKENLLADLDQVVRVVKQPQLRALFANTRDKLAQVPDPECPRLMSDIRAVYKGRHLQELRERQQNAQKSTKTMKQKRSVER